MNKTKIEWCDYTWNPVTGCLHGCPYCYARRIANRFTGGKAFPNGFAPTFHPDRLSEPSKIKSPSKIFVGSMADLFGEWNWVHKDSNIESNGKGVINSVLYAVRNYPQHTFIFLTKNPKRYKEFVFPENAWLGTTAENMQKAKEKIPELWSARAKVKFVSFEPMLEPLKIGISPGYIDWFIVGAQTGQKAIKPKPEWIESLIEQCRTSNTPLFLKDNLKWPEEIKEWPKAEATL
jgi:protein gp37